MQLHTAKPGPLSCIPVLCSWASKQASSSSLNTKNGRTFLGFWTWLCAPEQCFVEKVSPQSFGHIAAAERSTTIVMTVIVVTNNIFKAHRLIVTGTNYPHRVSLNMFHDTYDT